MRIKTNRLCYALIAIALVFALAIGSNNFTLLMKTYNAQAAAEQRLIRFTGNQNIREAADKSSAIITVAQEGEIATVTDQTWYIDKYWYYVTLYRNGEAYIGWTSSLYTEEYTGEYTPPTSGSPVSATTAEEYVAAGFPQSYAVKLAEISKLHPTWKFIAVNTNLDWNTVIKNESVTGRNLVENSDDDSHKSTASDAYDWYTNRWYVLDSDRWVAASSEYISYCMDPRNYLDEVYVFAFETLSFEANQTLAGVNSIVAGTFMANDVVDTDGNPINYAQTIYNIGQTLGVSPYHLASRIYQEQGTNGSSTISGTYSGYEGYFNYFNIGAYNTGAVSATENGLKRAKQYGWNTRYKSIYGGSEILARTYIKVGQDTLYFEKFNVVNGDSLYSHQYMSNVFAARSEAIKVAKGYKDKNQTFVFKIPIYNNMPETAVSFNNTGNPNNYLNSLSVSGITLVPAFNGATTSYTAVVGNGITSVNVSGTAVASTSSVSGTGSYNLQVGNNEISIICKAQNGSEKTYKITINRQAEGTGGGSSNNGDYSITSNTYKIGDYVTGIQPGTSAGALVEGLTLSNCSVKVLKADNSENTGVLATGNKLAIYVNSVLIKTIDIVIYGDVNGDGEISLFDLVRTNRYLVGNIDLQGANLEAGDVNRKNDGVDLFDLVALNRYLVGNRTIDQ